VSGAITSGGERGLLGLAFQPDYATSGRFYVYFTDPNGDLVVARFKRSAANPLVADPASRFDLRWSTGERVIRHPVNGNHNGGNLAFGPDGMLYLAPGDGGAGNDPPNNAQNLGVLLGKMLRINVAAVDDLNQDGFVVPADNPFRNTPGARPEIWDLGLRNPFRWSFDDVTKGGTGALVIGDVGQNAWEEVDYEPRGRGGRNYGWRIREGAHDNVTQPPATILPLVDPIFEYPHPTGFVITGGFVYRGAALPPAFRGRYFFADFGTRKVWTIALTIDGAGNATASDLRDHSAELGSPDITSFGVDAGGEIYFANYAEGTISRIDSTVPVSAPLLQIDLPFNGQTVPALFPITGWALDTTSLTNPGIDAIHVWAFPASGANPIFMGPAQIGGARPDVAAVFGSQFANAGYGLIGRGLGPGDYRIIVFALTHATGTFSIAKFVDIHVVRTSRVQVDAPANNATVNRPFIIGGWAMDPTVPTGTGILAIHVWAFPVSPGGSAVFLGAANFGDRPDVAAAFGSRFLHAGFGLIANLPSAGVWDILVFPLTAATNQFDPATVVRVTVR